MAQPKIQEVMQSPQYGLIEKIVIIPLLILRQFSASRLFRVSDSERRHVRMDMYNLLFLVVVTVALALAPSLPVFAAFIAIYRWVDVTGYRAYFLLVKSRQEPWTAIIARRSIVIAFINFVEVIICFAIAYLTFGDIKPTSPITPCSFDRVTALYFSAITMFTIGYGDFIPVNWLSRLIVMLQCFSSLVFFAFVIPALMSLFSAVAREERP